MDERKWILIGIAAALIVAISGVYCFFYEEKEVTIELEEIDSVFSEKSPHQMIIENESIIDFVNVINKEKFLCLADNQTIWLSIGWSRENSAKDFTIDYWTYWSPSEYIPFGDNLVSPDETLIILYSRNYKIVTDPAGWHSILRLRIYDDNKAIVTTTNFGTILMISGILVLIALLLIVHIDTNKEKGS